MYTPKTGVTASKINRERIEKHLDKNPDTTGVEICEALGLSKPTVYKHLAEIRREYLLLNPELR